MTQKDKELLLKDLCARMPYGVNGLIIVHITTNKDSSFDDIINGKYYDRFANPQKSWYDNIPCIKPYLRSMSSMTEEELNTYARLVGSVSHSLSLEKIVNYKKVDMDDFTFLSNWLDKKMLDYRGLIPMGLALEAPEGMYKAEELK